MPRVVGTDPGTSSLDLLLLEDGAGVDNPRLEPHDREASIRGLEAVMGGGCFAPIAQTLDLHAATGSIWDAVGNTEEGVESQLTLRSAGKLDWIGWHA